MSLPATSPRKLPPGQNRHHLTPRSRKGDDSRQNLLIIDVTRHDAWHKLFKNQTLEEVIGLLMRLKRMKRRYGKRFGKVQP